MDQSKSIFNKAKGLKMTSIFFLIKEEGGENMADFLYIPIKHMPTDVEYFYSKVLSRPEGLKALGWNPGEACSVTVIYQDGRTYTLIANRDRNGYSSISGSCLPHESVDEVVDHIRTAMRWESPDRLTLDQRAIISSGYEDNFQEVARALGLTPRRLEKPDFM